MLCTKTDTSLEIKALNIKHQKVIKIKVENNEDTAIVSVWAMNMETASDIVQSLLAEYLKCESALAKASFPLEFAKLNTVLEKIKESNSLKTHFAANIADSIQNLKVAVVKAEASLIINDI